MFKTLWILYMSILSLSLFCYVYTSYACSNLAKEFSGSLNVHLPWRSLDYVDREVFSRRGSKLGPGFITMKPKISRFVTNKGSRQGKLCS